MGLFARKNKQSPAQHKAVAQPSASGSKTRARRRDEQLSVETVLDALGQIVRSYGRNAFDMTETSARTFADQCEQWVRHILVGSPSPHSEQPEQATQPPQPLPMAQRDLPGFQRFVINHRRSEKQYVDTTVNGLKTIVIDSLSSLQHIMTDSTESDHDIKKQLSVLRQAAKSTSLDEIRRQAIRTVDLVSDAVESREELQQRQINYIGSRLQSVRKEMFDLQRHLGEDSLTRVFDRGAFDETLDKFANLSIFLHEPLTLMLVDVDNLKDVNELHGREAGDDVLKTVADELVRCFPRKTDFVGRYEGDRFVVLLVDTNSATASNLAHRVLHAIRHHTCKGHDASFSITCSVGVAVLQPSENARTLLTRTEQALSRAKTNGRDQVAEG